MVQQVNIGGIGVSQRLQQLVTGGAVAIDRFDTGKVFILSASAALGGMGNGLSLPSASAVESGFFATVLIGDSNNNWVIARATPDLTVFVPGDVVGNAGQSSGSNGGAGELTGANSGVANGNLAGARLEIYCDGVTWHLEGYGNMDRGNWFIV